MKKTPFIVTGSLIVAAALFASSAFAGSTTDKGAAKLLKQNATQQASCGKCKGEKSSCCDKSAAKPASGCGMMKKNP